MYNPKNLNELNDIFNGKTITKTLFSPSVKKYESSIASTEKFNTANSSNKKRILSSDKSPIQETIAQELKRVLTCQKEGQTLLKKAFKGNLTAKEETKYYKKWNGIEDGFNHMTQLTYENMSRQELAQSYASNLKKVKDVHRFANPAFLDAKEQKTLVQLGVSMPYLMENYIEGIHPLRTQIEKKIKSRSVEKIMFEGRGQNPISPFPYAPERLFEGGIIQYSGNSIILIGAAIIGAIASVAGYMEQVRQTQIAMRTHNLMVLFVLWFIYNDLMNKLAAQQAHLSNLQEQYREEERRIQEQSKPTPQPSPQSTNYYLGNMSPSKREVHLPGCSYVHLIRPTNLQTMDNLNEAHAAGLDKCHYCIGGSLR